MDIPDMAQAVHAQCPQTLTLAAHSQQAKRTHRVSPNAHAAHPQHAKWSTTKVLLQGVQQS